MTDKIREIQTLKENENSMKDRIQGLEKTIETLRKEILSLKVILETESKKQSKENKRYEERNVEDMSPEKDKKV